VSIKATVRALLDGGANLNLADGQGVRPLTLARQRGYAKIADMLEQSRRQRSIGVGWVNPGEGRGQTQHRSCTRLVLGHR
jgi:hypothetical protein